LPRMLLSGKVFRSQRLLFAKITIFYLPSFVISF
jgi:hypothetical protein